MRCSGFCNPKDESGFSLVELMVAAMILVVGILAVGQIFAVSGQNSSFSRNETTAVALAREIQEKILSEAVDQVPVMFDGVDTDIADTITLPCVDWAAHLNEQLGPKGRGRITVRDASRDPELLSGMYSVQIAVSWIHRGDTLEVPLRFAVTEIGNSN